LEDVEKIPFVNNPAPDEQELRKSWEGSGRNSVGDFVVVLSGDEAGREGFIKTIIDGTNIEIEETSKQPHYPSLIIGQHHEYEKAQTVSYCSRWITLLTFQQGTFVVSPSVIYCYDRVEPFDLVKVVDGPMTGRIGHVFDILSSGYLLIKDSKIEDSFPELNTKEVSKAHALDHSFLDSSSDLIVDATSIT
jgi:ribosomal protein L24